MLECIIAGSGFTGSTAARILAEAGVTVYVIEKRENIAGNMYDEKMDGILVQKYGPHVFHTKRREVYDFITSYGSWTPYTLRCQVYMDGKFTPSPFNGKTMDDFLGPEETAELRKALEIEFPGQSKATIVDLLNSENPHIQNFAKMLYAKDYSLYTAKQWGITADQVDPATLKRVPVRFDYADRYYDDPYECNPSDSYTEFFGRLLDHPNIHVITGRDIREMFLPAETDNAEIKASSTSKPAGNASNKAASVFGSTDSASNKASSSHEPADNASHKASFSHEPADSTSHKASSCPWQTDGNGNILVNIDGNPRAMTILYTGALDDLLDYRYGRLPYRSLYFEYKVLEQDKFQDAPVVAYPQAPDYTRVTEYNQLPVQKSIGKTVLAYEYPLMFDPDKEMEPYYPISSPENAVLYQKYLEDTKTWKGFFVGGRLADYKYYYMDDAAARGMELASALLDYMRMDNQ